MSKGCWPQEKSPGTSTTRLRPRDASTGNWEPRAGSRCKFPLVSGPSPSPRSTREAPEFFFTTPLDFFATVTDQTPAGTCTDSQLSVPSSQYLRPAGEVASSMYQDFCPEASSLSTLAGTGLPFFFMRGTVAS